MIPSSYAEWYECITVKCKIAMTREFVNQRLTSLKDPSQLETKKFTSLYGSSHLNRVISWFEQALMEESQKEG